MARIHILVDSLADEGLTNAQMSNAREIVRRLDPERFAVSIFHVGPADPEIARRPNTRMIRLPSHGQTLWILKELLLGNYDLVFYVKASPASKWYFRLSPKDHRPTIGTIESRSDLRNEPTIAPDAVRLWEQTVLRCTHLFSNSHAVRENLRVEYGLESEVVPTGVDTKFFTPPQQPPANSRPQVLFVGSLRPFKQPHMLLEAAARFPNADFVLAGDGSFAAELRGRVERQNLTNVKFLGHLYAQPLRDQYRQADIFLFPSLWEGSPKVLLEAAACGLPLIARKIYAPESVVDGKTGYLVSSDEELFVRLQDLLQHSELRLTFGAEARKHAEQFDWDGITRLWEKIFIRLTAAHPGDPRISA